jgi:hypothetical protein
MAHSSKTRARAVGAALTLTSLLPACGAADLERVSDGVDAERETTTGAVAQALRAGAGLTLTGTSALTSLPPDEGYAQLFDGFFNLTNNTGKPVTINKQLFFFAAPGGYAYPSPSFDIWWPSLPSSSTPQGAGPFGWGWTAPVAHLVARVDGKANTGTNVAVLAGIPIVASGKPSPGASPYTDDIDIGVQGPLEILNLTSGERWLPVTGTVVDTTQTATSNPSLSISARNSSGSSVATLSKSFGPMAAPIRTFIAWKALSASANVATLRITATQTISGGSSSQTRDIPVLTAVPPLLASPVSGSWMWANGPGETVWHAHTGGPEARYAYDMGVYQLVGGVMQSYSGNPALNSSYFCWNQPIRAVLAGTVRHVVGNLPDNNGNLGDNNQGNNEITIEHANGLFTRYAHMRQNTTTVSVGQFVAAGTIIGRVGNAGASSEPHLHFHAFKIDATGRLQAVPMSVSGMKSSGGTAVSGVPKGGFIYQTP